MITDQTNKVVWRWDNQDPFGGNFPDEDPDGDGIKFTCNLRFSGQYADRETGMNYNYFRDYDPVTGRYVESDPIELYGGINTYAYVAGNPLTYIDPRGLVYSCIQPLHSWLGGYMNGHGPFHHAFVCDSEGKNCYGQDWDDKPKWSSPLFAPGRPSQGDKFEPSRCEKIEPENQCLNSCIIKRSKNTDRPPYSGIPGLLGRFSAAPMCLEFADHEITICQIECIGKK